MNRLSAFRANKVWPDWTSNSSATGAALLTMPPSDWLLVVALDELAKAANPAAKTKGAILLKFTPAAGREPED